MSNESSNKYVQNNIYVHHHHHHNRTEEEADSAPKDNTLDVIGSIFMGIASIAVPVIIALAQQPAQNVQNQRRRSPKQKKIKN